MSGKPNRSKMARQIDKERRFAELYLGCAHPSHKTAKAWQRSKKCLRNNRYERPMLEDAYWS